MQPSPQLLTSPWMRRRSTDGCPAVTTCSRRTDQVILDGSDMVSLQSRITPAILSQTLRKCWKSQVSKLTGYLLDRRPDRSAAHTDQMGSFSYYVEVVTILSQIHQFLKKPVDIGRISDVERWQTEYRELALVLTNWKDSLPPEYGNTQRLFDSASGNKIVNCEFFMLHATYYLTLMRLHSSAAYPARRSRLLQPSFKASQLCLSAVESVSALCS